MNLDDHPRVRQTLQIAELLIQQLPTAHEGRGTWLMNHGLSDEADVIREKWLREHPNYTRPKEWPPAPPKPIAAGVDVQWKITGRRAGRVLAVSVEEDAAWVNAEHGPVTIALKDIEHAR